MESTQQIWTRPALLLFLASLILHLFANGHYGFFRDELYFIVCGSRPDWGYVDQPPVVPLLAAWSHTIFGDSLLGFRLLPALVMSATIALTAEFTRLLGGNRFAQWLAGASALLSPIFLTDGVLFSTDMFQALSWLGLGWVLVRLEQTGDERWWLAFGAILGFSLETKYLIAFYLGALTIGLLATPLRKSLLRPWVYLGALLAALIVLPNVLWQYAHGWPFIELGKAASGGKNVAMSLREFFLNQFILTGPVPGIVWLAGLWAGIARPRLAVARAFPIAWLVLLLTFDYSHGKDYYVAAIYPTLFAFGAVRIEQWVENVITRGAALALLILMGVVGVPLAVPILPVDTLIRYQHALGIKPASSGEHRKVRALSQYYADMFGWREMAAKVAAVYDSLPPQDRARAVFFGNNYGEAAAIDVFGRRLGLPPAISGHNNYYLWGPRGHDGSVTIILGDGWKGNAAMIRSFEVVGHITNRYAMPDETDMPIYVLRGLKVPFEQLWPKVKSYN